MQNAKRWTYSCHATHNHTTDPLKSTTVRIQLFKLIHVNFLFSLKFEFFLMFNSLKHEFKNNFWLVYENKHVTLLNVR